jgi:uncharacterized protein
MSPDTVITVSPPRTTRQGAPTVALQPLPPGLKHRFHAMVKPVGSLCNLDCKYCYYLHKQDLLQQPRQPRMAEGMLERHIRQYIEAQTGDEVVFSWQGGEPTILGLEFFREVVSLQARYRKPGQRIENDLQTNGTLLDEEWASFLKQNGFLVGLSCDGPKELHDRYRVDKQQRPTFDAVMRGLGVLKRHGAEFNTLTVVNRANSQQPLEVYRFLQQVGSGFIQFIPLVERQASVALKARGLSLAEPPISGAAGTCDAPAVTSWSVEPTQYGEFLVRIFDQWVRHDVGQTFVQLFDVALGAWTGADPGLCVFAERCGAALALEHNGDVYSCDHYVYPRHKLGNLMDSPVGELARSPQQVKFGNDKFDTLPRYCRECPYRFACNGESPKHRFAHTPDGEPGLNYLCPAYKRFFAHVDPYMKAMASLLGAGRAPAEIMQMLAGEEQAQRRAAAWRSVGRNDPCPCGSGRKYKKCCGAGR